MRVSKRIKQVSMPMFAIPLAMRAGLNYTLAIGLAFFAIHFTGCSRGPKAVTAPNVDANVAADGAMQLYDANHDGYLDENELKLCPGILNSLRIYDTDNDHKVSREEIVQRISSWKNDGPAMMSVECRVTLDGQPISDAKVRYIPEVYLEGSIKPAEGTTGENGVASISLTGADMPPQVSRIKAMNAGTYRVEITHPSIKIAERYNQHSTLGREISKQTIISPFDEFKLTSK